MRNARSACIVFCAVVAALGCRAPFPDWNGLWRLNLTKSTYHGQVLTISSSVDGEYRFSVNSSRTLHCDGKDRQIESNLTIACATNGATALDINVKENGVKTRATHDELSNDGKTLTTTMTEFRPKEPAITSQIIYSRLSGSYGFAGEWRDMRYLQQHADMTLRLDDQALHIGYPSASQQIDAPLDGGEAAVRGRQVPAGTTCAVRAVGNREFVIVTKLGGKVFAEGSMQLSSNGRIITNSWSSPDRQTDIGTLVYDKQ